MCFAVLLVLGAADLPQEFFVEAPERVRTHTAFLCQANIFRQSHFDELISERTVVGVDVGAILQEEKLAEAFC
jgi:hypothetical protein